MSKNEAFWATVMPNKEVQTYRHEWAFIIVANVTTYPLDILLNIMEQFCHPLPNELDHRAPCTVLLLHKVKSKICLSNKIFL